MFVVRPKGILGTPKKVADDLEWRLRKYPNPRFPNRTYDLRRDFLMMPVDPAHLTNVTRKYLDYYHFTTRHKYGQRLLLRDAGIPVPATAGTTGEAWGFAFDPGLRFVVRPLRHSGGRRYRVTESPTDFNPGLEYISVLFPKKREYRVIFVYGKPTVWLRKKPNEGVDEAAPWGAINSFFQTIDDVTGCRLSATDCVPRLSDFSVVKGAHIIAADILFNKDCDPKYTVLELNACPALQIDDNRAKIVEAIENR